MVDHISKISSPGAFNIRFVHWNTSIIVFICIQAYKSVYDAAVFCLAHDGQLAEQVQDFKSALDLCATVRGNKSF